MHNIQIRHSDSQEINLPRTSLCIHDNLFTLVVSDCCACCWFLLCDSEELKYAGKWKTGYVHKIKAMSAERDFITVWQIFFSHLLLAASSYGVKEVLLHSLFCPFLHLLRTAQTSRCTSIYMSWTKFWHLFPSFLTLCQGQIHANNLHLLRGAGPATPCSTADVSHPLTLSQDKCRAEGWLWTMSNFCITFALKCCFNLKKLKQYLKTLEIPFSRKFKNNCHLSSCR